MATNSFNEIAQLDGLEFNQALCCEEEHRFSSPRLRMGSTLKREYGADLGGFNPKTSLEFRVWGCQAADKSFAP